MTKYFFTVLVSLYPFLAATSGNALAWGAARSPEPPAAENISVWVGESGVASFYGAAYHGHRTAGGTRFDQTALTAAHPWLPFGSRVKVTLAGTNRSVIVTITDRLPFGRRIVDLSLAAARQLGMTGRGIAEVSLLPV